MPHSSAQQQIQWTGAQSNTCVSVATSLVPKYLASQTAPRYAYVPTLRPAPIWLPRSTVPRSLGFYCTILARVPLDSLASFPRQVGSVHITRSLTPTWWWGCGSRQPPTGVGWAWMEPALCGIAYVQSHVDSLSWMEPRQPGVVRAAAAGPCCGRFFVRAGHV